MDSWCTDIISSLSFLFTSLSFSFSLSVSWVNSVLRQFLPNGLIFILSSSFSSQGTRVFSLFHTPFSYPSLRYLLLPLLISHQLPHNYCLIIFPFSLHGFCARFNVFLYYSYNILTACLLDLSDASLKISVCVRL